MITRFATLTSRLTAYFAFLFVLAACGGGGGGGDGGGGFLPEDPEENAYFLSLDLLDAQGESTNTVTSTMPVTLSVRVTRNGRNGAAIENALVNVDPDIGEVTPDSKLSNADGLAEFNVAVGDSELGAGSILVSVENTDGIVTEESINFEIAAPGLRLGHFEGDSFIDNEIGVSPDGTLAYQGSAVLSIDIIDEDGNRVETDETITLSSDCLATGAASLDPESPLETSTGFVQTTYTASTCSGMDQVTARIEGGDGMAFADFSIASPQAGSLLFVSAEPEVISVQGVTGNSGLQHTSVVTFMIQDASGQPVSGIEASFSLSTSVGGITLGQLNSVSDAEGLVTTTVTSGTVATPVRVIASIDATDSGSDLSTVSDALSISTGLPDQDSISVGVEEDFVVEQGFTRDGVTRTIVVRMADRFNNPVPDGTTAQFTTEYGAIEPSCTTTNGECTVTWRSQEPRYPLLTDRGGVRTIFDTDGYSCPSHNAGSGPCPNDLGPVRGGRSTIMVTAIGEESFLDSNGNGIMDRDERNQFENLPEAFLDKNEDNSYTPSAEETFVDFNGDNTYNTNNNPALYNGSLCPEEGDGIWCSRTLLNVYDFTTVVLSNGNNGWYLLLVNSSGDPVSENDDLREGRSYSAFISDNYNNRPNAGSTVSITGNDGCIINEPSDFTVDNTNSYGSNGAFGITFTVNSNSGDNEGSQTPQGCPVETGTGTVDLTFTPSDDTQPVLMTWSCDWTNNAEQPEPSDPNDPC